MIRSPAKSNLLSPPKLVRSGGHYFPGVPSITRGKEEKLTLPGLTITEEEAVDAIYNRFEQMFERKIGGEERNPLWQNEFLFVVSCSTDTVWLLKGSSLFSKGIVEFREKTHVVFKDTHYGVLWKIIPRSDFLCNEVFDGCFTKNDDWIMDQMSMVNQREQFGSFLDIAKETPEYLLCTTLSS